MAVTTDSTIRHMLDSVFNHVPEESAFNGEYWWAPTWDRSGWIVAWILDDGTLDTLHTYRYPPETWGGLGVDTP